MNLNFESGATKNSISCSVKFHYDLVATFALVNVTKHQTDLVL